MNFEDVNFDFDKATLRPTAAAKIDEAVTFLKDNSVDRFELRGYADSIGTDAYNLKLSQRRADAVRKAINQKYKFDPNKFKVIGNGWDNPLQGNTDSSNMDQNALNRRVEIKVYPLETE